MLFMTCVGILPLLCTRSNYNLKSSEYYVEKIMKIWQGLSRISVKIEVFKDAL